jgi:hypothetical protein
MGYQKYKNDLIDLLEKVEALGVRTSEYRHCVETLYSAAMLGSKFKPGDEVKLVKEIDFSKSPGWACFSKTLKPGCVGTINSCDYNQKSKNLCYLVEIDIGREENPMFYLRETYLEKLHEEIFVDSNLEIPKNFTGVVRNSKHNTISYFFNGMYHRLNGPAVIRSHIDLEYTDSYFIADMEIPKHYFKQAVNLYNCGHSSDLIEWSVSQWAKKNF